MIRIRRGGKNFSNERGATLVESLIAVAIAGMAITALLAALSTGSIAVQRGDTQVTSQTLARAQIEYIKGQAYSSSYAEVIKPSGYSIDIAVSNVGNRDSNIQKIAVTVSFDGGDFTIEDFKMNR
jgi:type II secretory pathway pseudopilin PulG